MQRRNFLAMLGGAAACALGPPALAADDTVPLIGVLWAGDGNSAVENAMIQAFLTRLREVGWIDARTVRYEVRYGNTTPGAATGNAADLARIGAKVIITAGTSLTQAAHKSTESLPIVFVGATDPLASGLVSSLAHPGGNVTGFANFEFSIGAKWLELLKQVEPWANRVLVLMDPRNDGNRGLLKAIEAAAPGMSVEVTTADYNATAALDPMLKSFAEKPDAGVILLPHPVPESLAMIVADASKYRLPAVYPFPFDARRGGLISYGFDPDDLWRDAAGYVDRILKGEKPGDLPVQQGSKFNLVINLKTAKDMGLTIPAELLVRADEVIE